MSEKILIVDNSKDYLSSESAFLKRHGFSVYEAENKSEALRVLSDYKIDLIIIDVRLNNDADPEDRSGIDFAIDIGYKNIPKILITGFPDFKTVREALSFRFNQYPIAVNFISKQENRESLVSAINSALNDKDIYNNLIQSSTNVDIKFNESNLTFSINDRLVHLTPQEFKILKYFYENKNEVLTKSEIVVEALGETAFLENYENSRLVNIIYRLRKKIEDELNVCDLIITVRGCGYKLMID